VKTVIDIAARRLEKANARMVDLRHAAGGWEKTLEPIISTVEPKVIPSGVELLSVLHRIVTEGEPKGYLAITYWCNKKVEQLSNVVEACKQQTDCHRQSLQSSEISAINEWPQEVMAMEKALTALKVDTQKRAEKKLDSLREEHLKKLSPVDATLGMGCMGLLAGGALFVLAIILRQFIFSDFSQGFEKSALAVEVGQAMRSDGVTGFIKLIPATIHKWDTPEFWWMMGSAFCAYAWVILPITLFTFGTFNYMRRAMKIDRMVKLAEVESASAIAGKLAEKNIELVNLQKKIAEHLPTNRLHAAVKEQLAKSLNALNDVAGQLLKYRRQSDQ
jgi:hypothetical protein